MKKNLNPKKLLSCALLMLGGISSLHAATLTVNVKTWDNHALPGVRVELVRTGLTNQFLGVTNSSGVFTDPTLLDGIYYKVKVTSGGTSSQSPSESNSTTSSNIANFQTAGELEVVTTSGGVAAPKIGIDVMPGSSWASAGSSGSMGDTTFHVFSYSNMSVRANASGFGSYETQTVPFQTHQVVTFTNLVKLQSPNTDFLVGGTWVSGNAGKYVFPGTYKGRFNYNNDYQSNVEINGSLFNKVPVVILVKDSKNGVIPGAAIRGGYGNIPNGGGFGWHCAPTDSKGITMEWVDPANKICSYEAKVNGTTSAQSKDVTVTNGNIFTFRSNQLTLSLKDCAGKGIAGGSARYGIGNDYFYWFVPGANSTDGNGITTMEAFPGTYSFEMGINQSTQVKQIVFNGTNGLCWITTNVSVNWPYGVAYGGAGGNDWFPNKSGTEMLPGTWNFRLDGPAGQIFTPITVSGCSVNKFAVVARLINSDNSPIANGQPYCNGIQMPVTNESGNSIVLMDANPYSVITKMFYEGAEEWKQEDNVAANQIITFKTVEVTVDLNKAPNQTVYFRSGPDWGTFGTTGTDGKVTKQLLPTSYEFTPAYNTSLRRYQDVRYYPLVTFGGALTRMSHNTEAPAAVSFYPNPAVSSLNISMPADGTVQILSIEGKKLAQHEVTEGTTTIDVSSIPVGNYVMIVNYNGTTETHKFSKN